MRRAAILILAAYLLYAFQACEDSFVGTSPENRPTENFEAFWKQVDRHYAYFELKQVDWDSVRAVYQSEINAQTTDEGLLAVFDGMIQTLRDGHVNLYTSNRTLSYDGWYQGVPDNFEFTAIPNYVPSALRSGVFYYGDISSDIGYLFVDSFPNPANFAALERIMRRFVDKAGLIIDIRSNGGGNDLSAKLLAGYFLTEPETFGYIRWRNGPEPNDFSEWIPRTVEPAEENRFSGQVAILTNRRVFSASETFLLMMRQAPNATVIGDTTGGGSGNPRFFKLPNGWNYRVSRWQEVDLQFRQREGEGIFPDIPLWNAPTDSANGTDTILERAIHHLAGS